MMRTSNSIDGPLNTLKDAKMKNLVEDLVYKQEAYAIIGGCFAVYKDKGCGFLEAVYQECLEIEFKHLKLPAVPKPLLSLSYREHPLRQTYQPDFVCFGKIVLELKAVSDLVDEHRAQVLNYLNATGHQLGLLVNFGHYPKLEWERMVNTRFAEASEAPKPLVSFSL
jgi:GxxExxY protein